MTEQFGRLAKLSSTLLACPLSVVWRVEAGQPHVESTIGFDASLTLSIEKLLTLLLPDPEHAPMGVEGSKAAIDQTLTLGGEKVAAYLAAPMLDDEGKTFGGVAVISQEPRQWTQAEATSLQDLASLVSGEYGVRIRKAEVEQSRESISRVVSLCPTVLFLFDLEAGHPTYVNQEVASELGYGIEELLDMGPSVVAKLIHPEDLARYYAHLEVIRGLKDGQRIGIDFRLKHADGTWRWFLTRTSVYKRDAFGQVTQTINVASDITERKLAEAALERYQLLSQHVRDIILFVRPEDGRIVEANEAAVLAYGMPRVLLLNTKMDDLRAGTDHFDTLSNYFVGEGPGLLFETVHRRRDGSTFPVEVSTLTADVADDRLHLSIIRDITDRKRAERITGLEEERYRLATEAAFGICYEIDLRNDLAYASVGRLKQFLGYPQDEIEPTLSWWMELVHPDDRIRVVEEMAIGNVLREYQYAVEYRLLHHDGRYVWVLDRGFQFLDESGQPFRRVGCAMDVTDRKEAERALREKGERLKILSETVRHLLTSDQPRLFVGRLFTELAEHLDLEYYFNFVKNKDDGKLNLDSSHGLGEDLIETIRTTELGQSFCDAAAESGTNVILQSPEINNDRRLDVVRPLGMRVYACFPLMAGDRLLGTLGFGTSRRERFSVEEVDLLRGVCDQVGLAMERLELLNESRSQAERLREDDRRKDEFLAMLAHELRNPLAAIQGASQLLEIPDLPMNDLIWSRDVIDRQVGQLSHLIDDLLDISRITRGKIRLRKVPIDFKPIVDRALESTGLQFEAKQHSLKVTLGTERLPLVGDPTRLEQILVNLLSNAAKYSDPGGTIELSASAEDLMLVVRVKDNGIGIAADVLPRIFDIFTQIDKSLDRSQGGLGIGLALVKRLAEMHGGTISATSEGAGKGSEFTLRLPLDEGTEVPVKEPATPAELPEANQGDRKIEILVVDDNEDAALGLSRSLRLSGYRTTVAFNGPAALEAARANRPDVVILDIGLPGLTGYEVAETLIQTDGMTETLLIACTGYGQPNAIERSKAAGFRHHLIKPVDFPALLRLLAESAQQS